MMRSVMTCSTVMSCYTATRWGGSSYSCPFAWFIPTKTCVSDDDNDDIGKDTHIGTDDECEACEDNYIDSDDNA